MRLQGKHILITAAGQGIGKAVMKDITDTADDLGITLTLDAKPFGDTGLSKEALISFYEKNGFTPNLEEAFGGEFETKEMCQAIATTITPIVDSPHLKFSHRKKNLLFCFESEVHSEELVPYIQGTLFGLYDYYILSVVDDNLSVSMDEATKGKIVYPSLDPCVFEVKFPNKDIKGRAL